MAIVPERTLLLDDDEDGGYGQELFSSIDGIVLALAIKCQSGTVMTMRVLMN